MTMKRDAAVELADLSPVEEFHWATYVPGRTGPFYTREKWYKRHQTISHAKNALVNKVYGKHKYTPGAEIYEWTEHVWTLVFIVDEDGQIEPYRSDSE